MSETGGMIATIAVVVGFVLIFFLAYIIGVGDTKDKINEGDLLLRNCVLVGSSTIDGEDTEFYRCSAS